MLSGIAALLAIPPALAVEYLHCYPDGAPEGAIESDEEHKRVLAFGYVYIPVIYRRFCQLSDETDESYLDWITQQAGCSLDSPLGLLNQAMLTRPENEIEGLRGATMFREKCPDFYKQGCKIIEGLPSISAASGTPMETKKQKVQYNRVMKVYHEWLSTSSSALQSSGCLKK